jgi:ACR3 family arsenite efflux pump ArsB
MTKKAHDFSKQNPPVSEPKRLNVFERYLTVWVLICMVVGVALGSFYPRLLRR